MNMLILEILSRNQKGFGSFMNIIFNTIWHNIKTTSKKSLANCPIPQKSHRPIIRRPIVPDSL